MLQRGLQRTGAAQPQLAHRSRTLAAIGGVGIDRKLKVLLRHEARDHREMAVGMGHPLRRGRSTGQAHQTLHRDGIVADDGTFCRHAEEFEVAFRAAARDEGRVVGRVEQRLPQLPPQRARLIVEF